MLAFDFNSVPWGWLLTAGIAIVTSIGLALAFLISRAYVQQTIATLKETIASQEKSLSAKDKLAATLDEAYKATVISLEEKLKVMTDERDGYRGQLHATRAPMQAMQLKIQEYELRPDLNQVLQKEESWHARREQFYTEMAGNQLAIINTQRETLRIIGDIKASVDEELKQSNQVCAQVGKALGDIVTKMEEREEAAAERDRGMTAILTEILKQLKNSEIKTTPPKLAT